MGKNIKAVSAISMEDIPEINAILAKDDTAQLVPCKGGTVKIIHIKRKLVKTVQGDGYTKC